VISNLVFPLESCLPSAMIRCGQVPRLIILIGFLFLVQGLAAAASKPHILTFGKWATVQWIPDSSSVSEGDPPLASPLTLKVRPLLVDARVKEFTLGAIHEITERLFVVRRAFRVNDNLPQESASPPHWQWQRGGWLLVDRVTGHISPINLPEFDVLDSAASWYRDYAAYCGVSDDGKKLYAIVAQINRRKPLLRKLLDAARPGNTEMRNTAVDSAYPVPTWQRNPSRVSFEPAGGPKQTFAIRGHSVDLLADEEDEEASK
jgi:hypothetical protein